MLQAILIPITDFDPKAPPIRNSDDRLMAALGNINKHTEAVKYVIHSL